MKIIDRKSKPYPKKVIFDNGRSSPVPDQHKFKNPWIRNHGCSLAAFYIGLRFCGVKTKMNPLLKWTRKHLSSYIHAKLTIKGVARGLNKYTKRQVASYHRTCSYSRIRKALNAGHLVLIETGNPIHTNVIYRSHGRTYHLDHGHVRRISAKKLVSHATTASTYRGWVDIRG